MKILMSNRAHNDIDSIYSYISKRSIKYANETSKNLYSYIYSLEYSPYLGRYVPELFPNKRYRELLYKSYRIVYSISEDSQIAHIHFVVHAKRDFISIFNSYFSKNNLKNL